MSNIITNFMDDAFFKQSPSELQIVANKLGVPKNFFKNTSNWLSEKYNIPTPDTLIRITKKQNLIRKILLSEQYERLLEQDRRIKEQDRRIEVFRSALDNTRSALDNTHTTLEVYVEALASARYELAAERERKQALNQFIARRRSEDNKKEVEKPENPLLCIVCRDKQRTVVYNDCHHLVCCKQCTDTWTESREMFECPYCRTINISIQEVLIS